MANTFRLKRSSVQSRVPTTSDLDLGELAWNSYDGKLYGKKNDGTEAIVEIGANSGGSTDFSISAGNNAAHLENGNGYITATNSADGTSASITFNPPDLSAYLRSNATDTASGLITFAHDDGIWVKPATNATGAQIRFSDYSDGSYAQFGTIQYLHTDGAVTTTGGDSNDGFVISGSETRTVVKVEGDIIATGTIYDGSARVLTTADEGSENGLDADLLDGQHGSYYLNYNNLTNTPTIPSPLTTEQVQDIVGGMVTGNTEQNISVTYDDTTGKLDFGVTGGSGISNVVEDTTPSLGGNLDINGYSIYFADSNGTNNLIALGEASDFKIYHDPSLNYIDCSQRLVIKTGGNGVELRGDGTLDGAAGQIRLNCSANSHGIWLSAPLHSDFTGSYTFSFPANAGSNGQVLTTDGTGYTSWTTVSSGGGGIGSVVEDTTPQLGGVLDLNNQFIYSNASGLGSTYGDVSIVPIQTVYGSLDGGLKILCRDHTSGTVHSQYYFNGPDLSTPGSITASGNVTAYSDVKLKKDIKPIEDALDKISQIRGVTFQRNDLKTDVRFAGVIAQELEQVLPEVVSTDELGIKSVAYGNLVSLLIEAVKEQQAEINELKAHIYDQGK